MKWLDWTNMQFYQYVLIGGGAVALLALLLAFVPRMRMQIPAAVAGTLGGLVAGAALGVLGLASFGYHWEPQPKEESTPAAGMSGPAMMGMPGGGMPGGGRPGGMPGMGGGMGGGRGGSRAKGQLTNLVAKLDMLSKGPIELRLDDSNRKKVLKALEGLADQENLEDDVAQKKLDALLVILKDDRSTLENVGFRWPGAQGGGGFGGGGRQQPPNPFTEKANKEHLASLTDRLKQ